MMKPIIAGMLGGRDMEFANQPIKAADKAAKMKLAAGYRTRLEMMIGRAKKNSERPPSTCAGVSLKAIEMVSRIRKSKAAQRPERRVVPQNKPHPKSKVDAMAKKDGEPDRRKVR